MESRHAQTILKLLDRYTLGELKNARALPAIMALCDEAFDVVDQSGVYMTVPLPVTNEIKINMIKILRDLYGSALKETLEAVKAKVDDCEADGTHATFGPFRFGPLKHTIPHREPVKGIIVEFFDGQSWDATS